MKPLQYGSVPVPPVTERLSPEYMRHVFQPTPLTANQGVANYAYATFGAPLQSLIGAGTGIKNSKFGPGRAPMIALRTVKYEGISYPAGQFMSQPLAAPVI